MSSRHKELNMHDKDNEIEFKSLGLLYLKIMATLTLTKVESS